MAFKKTIHPSVVAEQLKCGKTLPLIDVREASEVQKGMIPGAIHIPLGELPERVIEFDQGKTYIMICRSGTRSRLACALLRKHGIKAVNMKGGMLEWEKLSAGQLGKE